MNHTYEVKEDKNYGYVLFKDKRECFCPFQQPVPTQGMGGVGLMRLPCSTSCPKANLVTKKQPIYDIATSETINDDNAVIDRVFYEVSCGAYVDKFEVLMTVKM
jgi:hypothetical protein